MANRYIRAKFKTRKPMKFRVYFKRILESEGCVGVCWPGADDGNLMLIDPRQSEHDTLDTILHEALHHLFPDKKERVILRSGTSLADLIWRLGYRRKKNGAVGRT